ncbi:hypothetical protein FPRO05_08050 [Fusarium proliferatum]|uniref:Zn(2)-C6 fungal-type domain-containing protein n=1 Tax=Gibberella intermedia TaxID=948311 RepID=A0A365NIJ5_GIBIN|nr:hypothetical protein FPRO05_08050 [Fusarium proliferatum]
MATRINAPKKVRLACRRCRIRRIKCDGQVPACTNCAKAGQVCLDVDSQNSDVVIPRNFVSAARERIRWLEDIIRDRLPDVDIRSGPQVDPSSDLTAPSQDERIPEDADITISSIPPAPTISRKRSAEPSGQSDQDESFPERAHSVAVNLGMLSLNIDSPQKHYLGSSSGLLFTNLIGASPPSVESTPQGPQGDKYAGELEWGDDAVAQDQNRKYHQELSISSIQGRPLGFRDETFDVKIPEVLSSPDDNIQGPLPPSFITAVTHYSSYHFRLDRIVSDIKLHLYHLPGDSSFFPWPDNPTEQQARIQQSLNNWWQEVSNDAFGFPSLDNRQREVWKIKLGLKYHTTLVLLFQPSQVIRQPASEALQACFDSAAGILDGYQRLHDLHGLHFGWRAVQNIFAAGATLIYSFWTSQTVREKASPETMSKNLRSCSTLLTIGGEWWPSARNGQASFGSVADLTMKRLYMADASNKAPRLSLHQTASSRPRDAGDADGPRSQPPPGFLDETGQSAEIDTNATWQNLDLDVGDNPDQFDWSSIAGGFEPEIEMFLEDFNRSDFSWSFPLNDNQDLDLFGTGPNPGF